MRFFQFNYIDNAFCVVDIKTIWIFVKNDDCLPKNANHLTFLIEKEGYFGMKYMNIL